MQKDCVTAVEKRKRGYRIVVNEDESFHMSYALFREKTLREGEFFSYEEFQTWLLPKQKQEALHLAVAMLHMRDHSEGEIRQKLKPYYPSDVIRYVVTKLHKEHWLNDEQFALRFMKARLQKQQGRAKIIYELRQRGVAEDVIQQAVDSLTEDSGAQAAIDCAKKLMKRYAKEEAYKQKQKVLASMARRGYSFQEASQAMNKAME